MRCFVFPVTFFRRRRPGGAIAGCCLMAVYLTLAPLVAFSQDSAGPPAVQALTPEAQPSVAGPVGSGGDAIPAPAAESPPDAKTQMPDSASSVSGTAPMPDLTAVPTLVPIPRDPPEAQEVEVPARPVAIISGDSTWDDSIVTLSDAFRKVNAALEKAGMKPAGRPIAVFTKSTDDGFSYDAMIPLAEAPAPNAPPLADGIRYGTVPPGKALRFIHRDPYELISMTYEAVALYMENKNLVGKDDLIEEYVTDITDQADKNTIVNIYVELADPLPGKGNDKTD